MDYKYEGEEFHDRGDGDCPEGFTAGGSYLLLGVFMVYILLSSFTVLNMLIGVLCEVVSATATGERQKQAVMEVKEKMESVFEKIDVDGSGKVSRDEFDQMKEDKIAIR